jgi:hypothetical protein
MRRILSERNLVVILFVLALVVFSFAHQETKRVEMMYMGNGSSFSSIPSPTQPADTKKEAITELATIPLR